MDVLDQAETTRSIQSVDFLAELRHELRTPLNAILGYSEMILEDASSTELVFVETSLVGAIGLARGLLRAIDTQMRSHLIESGEISLTSLRTQMRSSLDALQQQVNLIDEANLPGLSADIRSDVTRIVSATKSLSDLVDIGLTPTSVARGRLPEQALFTSTRQIALAGEQIHGRILVADDNPENLDLLTRRLHQQGHQVVGVRDGQEVIDILELEHFDLLLLDIMMPRVSGFDVLRTLRERDRLRELPVIMISALDDTDSVVEAIKLGAVDHLPKPFNPVILNARISSSLSVKRLRDKARAYLDQIEGELKVARDIQLMMLPKFLRSTEGASALSVHGYLSPARRIGGDLYDFFYGADGKFYFFIGDVCGKGIPAALYMTRTKTVFRLVTERAGLAKEGLSAGELMRAINYELARDNPSMMFVTALMGVIDPDAGTIDIANAGHPLPVLRHADGRLEELNIVPATPLGLIKDCHFAAHQRSMRPGTALFLYTDGVTDAMNSQDIPFGGDHVLRALVASPDQSPESLVSTMKEWLLNHAGETEQFDDITMLALEYHGLNLKQDAAAISAVME